MSHARMFAACTIACALTLICGPAFAQTAVATTIDISPLIGYGLAGVSLVIFVLAAWYLNGHVKDANSRAAIMLALEKGVQFGINKVEGALPTGTLSVNVGSSVAAQALKYVLDFAPQAAQQFGLTPQALAKMIWARLPAVDGQVSDDTFNQIAAAATGTAVAAPNTSDLLAAIAPVVEQAIADALAKLAANKTTTVTTASVTPAAATPAAA